ncbi:hypothetical protein HK098_007521, partial [Nowakowskiella sp. JEL0407]
IYQYNLISIKHKPGDPNSLPSDRDIIQCCYDCGFKKETCNDYICFLEESDDYDNTPVYRFAQLILIFTPYPSDRSNILCFVQYLNEKMSAIAFEQDKTKMVGYVKTLSLLPSSFAIIPARCITKAVHFVPDFDSNKKKKNRLDGLGKIFTESDELLYLNIYVNCDAFVTFADISDY